MSRRIDQFLADLPRDVLGVDESIVLDPITAVLLLVGRDRGLVVDLGECPACPPSHGPMLFASRDDARIWCRQNGHSTRMPSRYPGVDGLWGLCMRAPKPWAFWGDLAARPCPECTVEGKPTGRRTVPWKTAILDAMPRPTGGIERLSVSASYLASFFGNAPTREALAVLGDQLQASGDPLGAPLVAWLSGACPECELLDMAISCVAAWLSGACPECEGDGLGFLLALCKHCHGHGTRAGHFEPQLLDMAISCVAEERAS